MRTSATLSLAALPQIENRADLCCDYRLRPIVLRKLLWKWYELIQKIALRLEDAAVKERKLKDHGAKLLAEQFHRAYGLVALRVAADQNFSWVIICGTLTENTQSVGVFDSHPFTVWGQGTA